MKCLYTLILLCGIFSVNAQGTLVKKYAKVHDDNKYIISETVFEDGHIESYVTHFPLAEMRKMTVKSTLNLPAANIEWDENTATEGYQKTFADAAAIEQAFNNALAQAEQQVNLTENTFGRIQLEPAFFEQATEAQSFVLINKVLEAFAKADGYQDILLLEGVDHTLNKNSEKTANSSLQGVNDQVDIDYANFEFANRIKNTAIFLTNGEQNVAIPHIRAVYNWIFADRHSGWYNRNLIFNTDKNNGTAGLNDDYNIPGQEGYIGVGIVYGELMDAIVHNPTLERATAVSLQLLDPVRNSNYEFDIMDNYQNKSILAVDE